jgi:hypothetical protein
MSLMILPHWLVDVVSAAVDDATFGGMVDVAF